MLLKNEELETEFCEKIIEGKRASDNNMSLNIAHIIKIIA
jgi:hypothetical protein